MNKLPVINIIIIIIINYYSLQENSQNILLVRNTLETMLRFLNWSPLGYIFETKLISSLICKVSLECRHHGGSVVQVMVGLALGSLL